MWRLLPKIAYMQEIHSKNTSDPWFICYNIVDMAWEILFVSLQLNVLLLTDRKITGKLLCIKL